MNKVKIDVEKDSINLFFSAEASVCRMKDVASIQWLIRRKDNKLFRSA
jgi:hypothetical protein